MEEPYDLARFVEAQEGVYPQALAELRNGLKQSHWMWFIFPQVAGLGTSSMARRFAIGSEAEARAYLVHPLLGSRLEECTQAVLDHAGKSAAAIFGSIDAKKLRSSMTLFAELAGAASRYASCLDTFFGGEADPATRAFLKSGN